MNAIEILLDRPVFQALGWTLIHFIWQGALIAILYLSATVVLRRSAATVRYAAACSAMVLMLIAPAVTMLTVSGGAERLPTDAIAAEAILDTQTVARAAMPVADPSLSSTQEAELVPPSQADLIKLWAQDRLPRAMPWLLALWFAGVVFLSLRFAGGLVMVHRLKRIETSASVQHWREKLTELCHRLRVSTPVRLCESVLVEVPTVVGWLRPVILLPATALIGLSAEQLEALLAHELAHIRRYDYLINLLQTAIETLFFYHPAVWWVSAQVRQEREHCCDDLAVAACGDVLIYARALTALEHLRGSESQIAVAASGGSLLVRIQRLLRGRAPAFYGFESGLAGLIALATVFILLAGAQTALLSRSVKAAAVKTANLWTLSDGAPLAPEQTAAQVPASRVEPQSSARAATQPHEPAVVDAGSDVQQPSSLAVETPAQESKPGDSQELMSEMVSAGLTRLKPDQLVVLMTHGITKEYVREMSALAGKLTVDYVIAMRIHGVTSAFGEELKAQGLNKLNADQLIAFRIHGVTAQFVRELKSAGYGALNADSLVAFGIHGVTPEFIQQMKDFGYSNLSGDQLVAFRIHGVTPLFVQTMRSFIRGRLSADDLIGLRIHGVTPEMSKELEIMGYTNLSAPQLMAFRIHGVSPAYIRSIQDAGYDRVTADQLTELRISGVTPEFIQTVKSRGFTDVTLPQPRKLRGVRIMTFAKKN